MGQTNKQVTMIDLFLRIEQPVAPDTIVTRVGLEKVQQTMIDHLRDISYKMHQDSRYQEAWDNRDSFVMPYVFHPNYQK